MRKIILDTDIGSDIDDCFCLAYLLSRDDVEILGITTVSGLPGLRAQLADKVCRTYGKNIPVFVGNEKSLSNEIRQPKLTKAQTAVADSNEQKFSADKTAMEFLKTTIENNPKEINLVCMGQLTNIAEVFTKYPHIPGLLEGIVIMGGRYADNEYCDIQKWGKTEWNILCDIKAAKIVYGQNIENFLVMGVEQTCRFCIPPEPIKKAFNQYPKFKAVSDSVNTVAKQVYFHDVMTVYAWLHPDEVTIQQGNINVEVSDTNDYAKTAFSPKENGRHFLVTDFSPDKFFENYINTVGININNTVSD